MVAPEAEVPEAVLRSPRYFSPGGFRIGSAARHRAQARGGQGEDQADLQQQISLGVRGPPPLQTPMFTANLSAWCRHPRCRHRIGRHAKAGETCIPGDVAGGTRRFLSYTIYANLIASAQAGATTLVHRHPLW
jgi:hypothetical protein